MAKQRKEIHITISPKGAVTYTVTGVKGASCVEETQFLDEGLAGGKVESREVTGEYYEKERETAEELDVGRYATMPTSHSPSGRGSKGRR